MNKIENYLYFLLGKKVEYSINDRKYKVIINNNELLFSQIKSLQQKNILNCDIQNQAETFLNFFDIDEAKLELAVLEKMKLGQYYLAYWLQQPVEILKIEGQYVLAVLNDFNFDPKVIRLKDLFVEEIVFEEKNYINIIAFNLSSLKTICEMVEQKRLDFIQSITALKFRKIHPKISLENFQASLKKANYCLYRSPKILISNLYYKWFKSELDELQSKKYLEYFEKKISKNIIVFYFKRINIGNYKEHDYRNAINISNCLEFFLGVTFIPTLSQNSFSLPIRQERLKYIEKKLSESNIAHSYQFISIKKARFALEIANVNWNNLLNLVIKKLLLGVRYCQVIFDTKEFYINLNYADHTVQPDEKIIPHLVWTSDRITNVLPNYEKMLHAVSDEEKNIITWFDEYQLYGEVSRIHLENARLLHEISGLTFGTVACYMEKENIVIADILKGLQSEKKYRLPEQERYTVEIAYKAVIPMEKKRDILNLIKNCEKNEIFKRINHVDYWQSNEKKSFSSLSQGMRGNNLTSIEIVIVDKEKLKIVDKLIENKKINLEQVEEQAENCLIF